MLYSKIYIHKTSNYKLKHFKMASNGTFAQQISVDEYYKQKKEYTEKALAELKLQMAEAELNKKKAGSKINQNKNQNDFENTIDNDNDDDDNDNDVFSDCSSSSGEKVNNGVNVIINSFKEKTNTSNEDKTGKGRRVAGSKSKIEENSLSSTIYVQRELDLQEMQNLKRKIIKLKETLVDVEKKNHFLKLDYCNALVDNTNLSKKIVECDSKIQQYETKKKCMEELYLKMKFIIIFEFILFLSFILLL